MSNLRDVIFVLMLWLGMLFFQLIIESFGPKRKTMVLWSESDLHYFYCTFL